MAKRKVFLLSLGAQEKEIDELCFKKCGQILMGVITYCPGEFYPCKTEECPFEDKKMLLPVDMIDGDTMNEEEEFWVRKLKEVMNNG